jgi:predicted nucleic acid-binding Zn ribbon protein
MTKKCEKCGLANFADRDACARCGEALEARRRKTRGGFVVRGFILLCVCLAAVLGFYLSLLLSADPLNIDQKSTIRRGAALLREKGFSREAFLLEHVTIYRGNDNWLNSSVAKENAYAATNFPFEIMTVYPDFFTYSKDEIERAAILLHESKHLEGKNEHDAYAFVWQNKSRLGWSRERYSMSPIWDNVRRQTREAAPELFKCPDREFGDCIED